MRTKQDENIIENLIRANAKLEFVLDQILWTLNYMQENYNETISMRQTAEIMNRIESALAESHYIFENRYEKLGA